MIMCTRQRTRDHNEGRDGQLARACRRRRATCRAVAVSAGFHACLTARADELSDLADAVLCPDGPVRTLAGLPLPRAADGRLVLAADESNSPPCPICSSKRYSAITVPTVMPSVAHRTSSPSGGESLVSPLAVVRPSYAHEPGQARTHHPAASFRSMLPPRPQRPYQAHFLVIMQQHAMISSATRGFRSA